MEALRVTAPDSRSPLVLVGGWGHPPRSFEALATRLGRSHNVRVVLPDPAVDILRPSKGAGEPVVLVGWSLGGLLALEAAAGSPERVRALVLVSATPRFCSAPDFPHGTPEARLRALGVGLHRDASATLGRFWRDCAFPHAEPAWETRTEETRATGLSPGLLSRGLACLQKTDLRALCRSLQVPCFVLHGREDRVVPWEAGEWLARRIPEARWSLLDAVGHDLPLRQPERVATMTAEL